MSYIRIHLFLTYTLIGIRFLCLVMCNGEMGGCDSISAFLVLNCVYLDIINSCTSFSLKNNFDLEFYDKMIVAEKK